jgi:hypothetical protein
MQDQGIQEIARSRTNSTSHKQFRRMTQRLRKRTIPILKNQSPKQIPISLAVKTLSLSMLTLFLDLIASAKGTAFMTGVARATI